LSPAARERIASSTKNLKFLPGRVLLERRRRAHLRDWRGMRRGAVGALGCRRGFCGLGRLGLGVLLRRGFGGCGLGGCSAEVSSRLAACSSVRCDRSVALVEISAEALVTSRADALISAMVQILIRADGRRDGLIATLISRVSQLRP
jgi:hypothetical protein